MKLKRFPRSGPMALAAAGLLAWAVVCATVARAQEKAELPVHGTEQQPALLMELGKSPASVGRYGSDATVKVRVGEVAAHEGDDYVSVADDEVVVARKGIAQTSATFRFTLDAALPESAAGAYAFWARWKQGGDPNVCGQTFVVLAGPGADKLEERGSFKLTNDAPWRYQWVHGDKTIKLIAGDRVIDIRNSGQSHDAKVFDAFLLSPGPAPAAGAAQAGAGPQAGRASPVDLPVKAAPDRPVVVLGFGPAPLGGAGSGGGEGAASFAGSVVDSRAADYASVSGDVATVAHKGFGEWGATFEFNLDRPVQPGFYGFHARYMHGGEASQVGQTFVVRAGPDRESLGERGVFRTTNRASWKHAWVAGEGAVALFPGDRVVQIVNSGKAHDAKVFSGFVLGMLEPMPSWMTPQRGAYRSAFLALARKSENPQQHLYLVDGDGPGDKVLFAGLTQEAARSWYAGTQVHYLLGERAEEMAARLNVTALPAAVVVNADRRVLGVLSSPGGVEQVSAFLSSPEQAGAAPAHAKLAAPAPEPLVDGAPRAWLVATGWPGRAGLGHWGLDAEALQRPNPGDLYAYGYFTAGNRWGRWAEQAAGEQGVCVITEALPDSYAWGRGTSYAVAYLHVDEPVTATLHLQHSGVQSAVYLDGVEQALTEDAAPPVRLARQEARNQAQVVERAGQEIHDDVSVPQAAEAPRAARLSLSKGTHCLILKLVHAQGKGESVLFSAQLMGAGGTPLRGVKAGTSDPEVALAEARTAAGLWPLLTLEGVPGNLPRPGEPLTLVADLRVPPQAFLARWLPEVFLPLEATLRVRIRDYDGNELRTVEARGTFPGVVKLDLGPAPEAGYYALVPELVGADGRLIHRFHPDGFSVVLGNAAQRQRVDQKELMNSYYYAFNQWETLAPWLERTGLFKNVGSTPGVSGEGVEAKWEDAHRRGIVLFGDFAGDSHWMNNDEKHAQAMVDLASKYTRYFKGINEVDGRFGGEEGVAWHISRNPEKYVERTRWQHQAVHRSRPDAVHFGGSVYTSGNSRRRDDHPEIPGPRQWLRKCLELGLDNYIDAWDVHAYPQYPPRLEAPSVSNSPRESDLGVLDVYGELGMTNTKPFLLGETSAMTFHGFTGLRWQAETLAKLTAWTNSRADWLGVALCAAQHNRRITAEEYAMAHNPGEAAIYTASALIDGLPYRRVATEDAEIQAAYFGETFMIWRADDRASSYELALQGDGPWVVVDVVGRVKPLEATGGSARLSIGSSPLYVLTRREYERLTALE